MPAHGVGADDGASPPQFRDIGEAADLGYRITCGDSGTESLLDVNGQGACFLAYDSDGHLDLYLTNYGLNRLYRNGGGEFLDISEAAGVSGPDWKPAKWSMGAEFADIDNDGDQDLNVVNDSSPNFYCTNRGDRTFEDVSWESAGTVNEHGESEGSKGLTVGDYNNDGRLDIFISNFVKQSNTLYENDGDNLFLDQTTALGLDPVGFNFSGWGTKFFDFDNDGWLDLFVTNGHTDERLELSFPSDSMLSPTACCGTNPVRGSWTFPAKPVFAR